MPGLTGFEVIEAIGTERMPAVVFLTAYEAAGVNIISANGDLVDFGNGVHNICVEDPNGMNIELFECAASR